jgi:cellulose synthase/poly-beta-1,6-N-acetylglucosamine synthase-like glycosyltransferase
MSLALLVYVYLGYPVVAVVRARLRGSRAAVRRSSRRCPIIVVAHNEEERIGARIDNLIALDYPRHKIEIGHRIGWVHRWQRSSALCATRRSAVNVRAFNQHRGKPAVVNAVVPTVRGDIVIFADARQRFEPQTVRELVANFADAQIGAASGELIIQPSEETGAAGHGASFYWRYEKFIRNAEGQVDSTIGATAPIYAIRRKLFEPIPDDTLLDDVAIPLKIMRQGYRVVFEPNARAYDGASETAKQEFVRKTRTIAGMFQLVSRETWC